MNDMDRVPLDPDAVRHHLDREIGEVRAAILLVSRGAASRVSVGGLSYGDIVRILLGPEAARARVTIEPEFGPDDAGCDLAVVASDDR